MNNQDNKQLHKNNNYTKQIQQNINQEILNTTDRLINPLGQFNKSTDLMSLEDYEEQDQVNFRQNLGTQNQIDNYVLQTNRNSKIINLPSSIQNNSEKYQNNDQNKNKEQNNYLQKNQSEKYQKSNTLSQFAQTNDKQNNLNQIESNSNKNKSISQNVISSSNNNSISCNMSSSSSNSSSNNSDSESFNEDYQNQFFQKNNTVQNIKQKQEFKDQVQENNRNNTKKIQKQSQNLGENIQDSLEIGSNFNEKQNQILEENVNNFNYIGNSPKRNSKLISVSVKFNKGGKIMTKNQDILDYRQSYSSQYKINMFQTEQSQLFQKSGNQLLSNNTPSNSLQNQQYAFNNSNINNTSLNGNNQIHNQKIQNNNSINSKNNNQKNGSLLVPNMQIQMQRKPSYIKKLEDENKKLEINKERIQQAAQNSKKQKNFFRKIFQDYKVKEFFLQGRERLQSWKVKNLTSHHFQLIQEYTKQDQLTDQKNLEIFKKKEILSKQGIFQKNKQGDLQLINNNRNNNIKTNFLSFRGIISQCKNFIGYKQRYIVEQLSRIPKFNPEHWTCLVLEIIICLMITISIFFVNMHHFFNVEIYDYKYFKYFVWTIFAFLIFEFIYRINTAIVLDGKTEYSQDKILEHYKKYYMIQDLLVFVYVIIILCGQNWDSQSTWLYITESIIYAKIVSLYFILLNIEFNLFMKGVPFHYIQLANTLSYIMLLTHIIGCFWHLLNYLEIKYDISEQSWIQQKQIDDLQWDDRYFYCVFWSASLLMLIGAEGYSQIEIISQTIILFFTVGIFAYILQNISEILKQISLHKQQFKNDLEIINKYMNGKNLDLNSQIKVRQQLEYCYTSIQDINVNQEAVQILEKLPGYLSNKIKTEMNKSISKKFIQLNQHFSKKTINEMLKDTQTMKEQSYVSQDIIFHQNQQDQDIYLYLIMSGEVQLYYQNKNEQGNISKKKDYTIKTLKSGEIFGDRAFFTGLHEDYSAKSTSFSNIFQIKRQGFISVLQNNESDYEKFNYIKDMFIHCGVSKFYNQKCILCNSNLHNIHQCSMLFFRPYKFKFYLENKHMKNIKQKRNRYFRGQRLFNASALTSLEPLRILNTHFRHKYPEDAKKYIKQTLKEKKLYQLNQESSKNSLSLQNLDEPQNSKTGDSYSNCTDKMKKSENDKDSDMSETSHKSGITHIILPQKNEEISLVSSDGTPSSISYKSYSQTHKRVSIKMIESPQKSNNQLREKRRSSSFMIIQNSPEKLKNFNLKRQSCNDGIKPQQSILKSYKKRNLSGSTLDLQKDLDKKNQNQPISPSENYQFAPYRNIKSEITSPMTVITEKEFKDTQKNKQQHFQRRSNIQTIVQGHNDIVNHQKLYPHRHQAYMNISRQPNSNNKNLITKQYGMLSPMIDQQSLKMQILKNTIDIELQRQQEINNQIQQKQYQKLTKSKNKQDNLQNNNNNSQDIQIDNGKQYIYKYMDIQNNFKIYYPKNNLSHILKKQNQNQKKQPQKIKKLATLITQINLEKNLKARKKQGNLNPFFSKD